METVFAKTYPEIRAFLESVPRPDVKFLYGTAGFRMNYELLPSIFARVGIIAVLRSKYLGKVHRARSSLRIGCGCDGDCLSQSRVR